MPKEKMSFEDSLAKLEQIVERLQNPEVPIKEGFALYEEGMKLSAELKKELQDIEKKVRLLQKNNKGELQEGDFDDDADSDIS